MASLIRLTGAELFKLIRQPLAWIALLALLLLLGLNFSGKVTRAQEPPSTAGDLFTPTAAEYHQAVVLPGALGQVQMNFHLPAFFLLILAAATSSQEFGWGAMRTVLSREPGRGRLLVTRLAAMAAVDAFCLIIIWAGYAILGLWASSRLEGAIDLSFVNGAFLARQLAMLVRVWLATLPVITFGLLVAVAARNTAISIMLGGMAYFLAWMTLMFVVGLLAVIIVAPAVEAGQDLASIDLGIWGQLLTLSPLYNMGAVAHWGETEMMITDVSLSGLVVLGPSLPHGPWRGLGLLWGYGLISLTLAWWIFRRQDVTI
jgi:ABC-type transport system involved in multi-copper enzyme maturation permease subunit